MSEEPPSDQVNSLRDSLNRWNQTRQQNSQGFNESAKTLFSSWADSLNTRAQDIYQTLPVSRQDLVQDQEPSWFQLSRTERMVLFVCFLLGATRKFGLLWTMGSLLFVLAFGVLMGPLAYLKHLTARERLPFSMFFFATCFMTIYFAAFSKNTVLTITCALLELVAVIYYAISYFPFGATGLRMLSSAGVNSARGVLRI